ncbi:unnamed protein product, partial [Ectocarpus fasciculatus]
PRPNNTQQEETKAHPPQLDVAVDRIRMQPRCRSSANRNREASSRRHFRGVSQAEGWNKQNSESGTARNAKIHREVTASPGGNDRRATHALVRRVAGWNSPLTSLSSQRE